MSGASVSTRGTFCHHRGTPFQYTWAAPWTVWSLRHGCLTKGTGKETRANTDHKKAKAEENTATMFRSTPKNITHVNRGKEIESKIVYLSTSHS